MTATRGACRQLWLPLVAAAVILFEAAPVAAAVEVKLRLPVRARIDLTGKRSITPSRRSSSSPAKAPVRRLQGRVINVQQEFERYLLKVLRRETELKVLESGPVDYPSTTST